MFAAKNDRHWNGFLVQDLPVHRLASALSHAQLFETDVLYCLYLQELQCTFSSPRQRRRYGCYIIRGEGCS